MIAPVYFVYSWALAGAIREGYNPVYDAISRLAELGAPNRYIVTSGMVVFGIGCILFAPLLRKPATVSFTIAGLASFGVALFPCTQGCPGLGTVTDTGHSVFAGVHYVALVLTPILHSRRRLDLVLAGVAAFALASHALGIGPNGLLQRTGLTTLDVWLVWTAIRVSRSVSAPDVRQPDDPARSSLRC